MARSASEALWRGRIAAQAKSRLSALAYCTQQGFSPKSFYAWRRRLKQDKVAKQTPLFVPVELPAESLSAGNLRIELPGGAVVVLPPEASQERLVTVLRAVLAAAGERSSC
jgi:hypothetical protein